MPLLPDDVAKNNLVQFPQVIISITPVVHLAGIKPGEIVLDGPTLADIYLGKIKEWDDPAIKKLNLTSSCRIRRSPRCIVPTAPARPSTSPTICRK